MRGADRQTAAMFSYLSPEAFVPPSHLLRAIRPLVNAALGRLSPDFAKIKLAFGRQSIAPEKLLRAQAAGLKHLASTPTRSRSCPVVDRLWQNAYWLGFRLVRAWWWIRRPDHHGAVVAIWFDGRILIVRQSYRTTACLPGGGIKRGEDPRDAVRRELFEELGLATALDDLTLVSEIVLDDHFGRDHVRVFELQLDAEPQIRIDNREIVAAGFVEPQALLAEQGVSRMLRAYLLSNPNVSSARVAPEPCVVSREGQGEA